MAITIGLVDSVDDNGVYVKMPGSRGLLRGPYQTLQNVTTGDKVLVVTTDDGEDVIVGQAAAIRPRSTPATSTDNAVARFDGTGGALQGSGVIIDDSNVLSTAQVTVTGVATPVMRLENSVSLAAKNGSGSYEQFLWPRWSDNVMYLNYGASGWNIRNSGSNTRFFLSDAGKLTLHVPGEGIEFGSSGPRQMTGTGGPSGVSAPVGSTWRQTDANSTHGSLSGLLWNKTGTGTTEGTDWLVDYEGRWITYTVDVTGWTKGSGTVTGYYTRTGRRVSWHCTFALNSTTVSGSLTLSLPVTPAAYTAGEGVLVDAGTSTYLAMVRLLDTGLAYVSAIGTNGAFLSPTSTVPFTWANGDSVIASATYRI